MLAVIDHLLDFVTAERERERDRNRKKKKKKKKKKREGTCLYLYG